jgi:hypothetical protein
MSRAFSRFADASGRAEPPKLLGEEWLTRWRRSDAKFPATLPVAAREEFERRIEGHPQFVRGRDGTA